MGTSLLYEPRRRPPVVPRRPSDRRFVTDLLPKRSRRAGVCVGRQGQAGQVRQGGSLRLGDGVYRSMRASLAADCAAPRPSSTEHELHVDADAVCPRCLRWIEPDDYVRRTAYGPHQHESCA